MKRYIALLRGINISGKNKIAMADLKTAFEKAGYEHVRTHLNSGNVLFDAEEAHADAIVRMIRDEFALNIPVHVLLQDELRALLDRAPEWWDSGDKHMYDNLIFILSGANAAAIAETVGAPSEGIEQVELTDGAIFWSFVTEKHAKANWWKRTAQPGIGEHITVRTANTCKKLISL